MEHVLAYASRTLCKWESSYFMTEKKCLDIVWAVGKFRPYLYMWTSIQSGNKPPRFMLAFLYTSGTFGRWTIRLQQFNITITYESGRRHADTDALSSCALQTSEETLLSHDDILALSPFAPPHSQLSNSRTLDSRI